MKINISNIKKFFFTLPFIEPQYIQNNIRIVHYIYELLRFVNIITIVFVILINRKVYKPSKSLYIVLTIYLWLLVSTIFHGGNAKYALYSIVPSLVLCIYIDYYIRMDTKGVVDTIAFVLAVNIFINFICILIFPNGMYNTLNPAVGYVSSNWFLGYKNPQIRVILPAISLVMISNYLKNKHLNFRGIAIITIGIISTIRVNSGTAIIGMFTFIIAILYFNTFNESKVLSIWNIAVLVGLAFVGIVTFNFQELFSSFLNNTLQRDVTFTGRTAIWARYYDYILQHVICGVGILDSNEMIGTFGTSHPHNYLLYILLQGGIVGLVMVVYLVITVSKAQKKYIYFNSSHVLICCIVSFWIMGLVESLTECIMLYPIYILAGNIDKIAEVEKT